MRQFGRVVSRTLVFSGLMLIAAISFSGCSGGQSEDERIAKVVGATRKSVVPVKGTITVNGKTEKGVVLTLYNADGTQMIPTSDAYTNDKGEFLFTTYVKGDGLEPGEYRVTFEWLKMVNKGGIDFQGSDKFKGKYSSPAKTEFKLVVQEGLPQTNLSYELVVK